MSADPRNAADRAGTLSRLGRLWRIVALAAAVSPLVRWAIFHHAVPPGQPWRLACSHCGLQVGASNWRPLTPVGRCGRCQHRLGPPSWSVEIMLIVALAALAWARLPAWIVPAYAWWTTIGVALAFIDVAVRRLPDRLTWTAAGGFLALAAPAVWHGYGSAWLRAAGSAALLTVVIGLCAWAWPALIKHGDVKYGAAIGGAAGWVSWFSLYAAVFTATFLGALVGIGLIATGRASRGSHLPFGPFLLTGTLLVVVLTRL